MDSNMQLKIETVKRISRTTLITSLICDISSLLLMVCMIVGKISTPEAAEVIDMFYNVCFIALTVVSWIFFSVFLIFAIWGMILKKKHQNNKINTEFNLKNNTEGDFYEK